MRPLQFLYRQENPQRAKKINERKKIANELEVTVKLAPYLEEINKSGSHILVTIDETGEHFKNEIVGKATTTKYATFIRKG